ncbi:MAG: alpha-rhamnosidase, partial [Pedobacter sp.]
MRLTVINMKSKSARIIILLGIFVLLSCQSQKKVINVQQLTAESRNEFIGLQNANPLLSWKIGNTKKNNTHQIAYQVLVSSSEKALNSGDVDLWNSGKVVSDSSTNVKFKGKGLESYKDVYWKVKIWTNHGDSATSPVNHWKMAILNDQDWKASWIGLDTFSRQDAPQQVQTRLAARYFRKEVLVEKEIKKAVASISGLGLYELYINGGKIGNDVLSPTPVDYRHEVPFNTYDVTNSLRRGKNGLGVILGNGRFFKMRDFGGKPNPLTQIAQVNYGYPKLILQIRIEYTDGSMDHIASDQSWKVTDKGPIKANNEYDGEEYDARNEINGWANSGFDDHNWTDAHVVSSPGGRLFAQTNENIKIKQLLNPKTIYRTPKGTYILDMGQNMVGWLKIQVKGTSGDTISMKFSERLKSRDTLYTDNLRDARANDIYIIKGTGKETWAPRFTYHGFQYVEISGLNYQPSISDFEGQVVYDDIATIGQFHTSDSTINKIYKNSYWSIRGNYRGIPTDCPQRDERVAWLGDRLMSSYGESFVFDNSRIYSKWMADTKSAQKANGSIPDIVPAFWVTGNDNVTYPSAFIIIPEMLRKQFGDNKTYTTYYPYMKKWMLYMWSTYSQGDLVLKDTYGDWCVAPEEGTDAIWTNDPKRTTDGGLLAASYYYYCLTLMENFAELQGFQEDVQTFVNLKARVLKAFNIKFYNEEKGFYGNNTTTANLLPLTFGLVPVDKREIVFQKIIERTKEYNNHISSGIMGMMW